MSSWLSFESFLHSGTAKWCRRGLFVFFVGGVGGDYWMMHHYRAFDPSEGRRYLVDCSPINRRRCTLLLVPSIHFTNYSPWTPRNGDVVLAREVEGEPNYLQLINGRFVESRTCSIELLRPMEEVEREEAAKAAATQQVREMMMENRANAT